MRFSSKLMVSLALVLSFLLLLGAQLTYAQDKKMSMDEYRAQLKEWQDREVAAKKAAEDCANAVTKLTADMAAAKAESGKLWGDILTLAGTDQAGYDAYKAEVKALEAKVDGLLALSPEELFKKRDELAAAEAKLAELKKNKIYALTEMQNALAAIEGKIAQLKNKMPKALYDMYTVVVGDYLWKISGKKRYLCRSDAVDAHLLLQQGSDQESGPDLSETGVQNPA